jgi:hypothetical protein
VPAELVLHVYDGTITCYSTDRRNSMVASCGVHGGQCRRERTLVASDGRPEQGRPLGFLLQFLYLASSYGGRHEHCAAALYDPASRLQRRVELELMLAAPAVSPAIVAAMIAAERPRRPGEGLEPDRQP